MKNKVLIIGIDALDPKIINKLKDKLPNFKRLETFTLLETTIPPETPVAWSAASTGTNPGKYGIFDFIDRDLKNNRPRLNLTLEKEGIIKPEYICAMRGTPFWRILTQNNIPTTVIRWPVTFPPEKVKGRMLSGLGVVDAKGMLNNYSIYTEREIKDEEGKEKIVRVNIENNAIKTYISGPLIRKKDEIIDKKTPMDVEIKKDEIIIKIDKKDYHIKNKEWSEIIKVKFRILPFIDYHGIFNIYLLSIKPFEIYMSSIQIDPENQFIDITYPREYGKELVENIGLFYTLGMPEDTKAVTEHKISRETFIQQVSQIENERKKMFFYEFDRFNEGVYAFAFDSGDRLKHLFWRNNVEEENFEIPGEIEEYYTDKDKFLGEVLSKMDDHTKLIIFSDHGFGNFQRQVNINSWLAKEGYIKIKGNKEDSLFKFVDWENTKAYSVGFTSLYINMKNREDLGIVRKEEYEEVLNEILNKLKNLRDNEKLVFTRLYKGKEIYKGEYSNLAPDIVLGFSQGYRMSWKNAIGALDSEIISDNDGEWRGDHLMDRSHVPGVLFTNFKINKKNPSIMDIAPTILKICDIKIPEDIDGAPLV